MKTKNAKRVTLGLLEKLKVCDSGIKYWKALPKDENHDPLWLMQHAIESDDEVLLRDASCLIVHLFSTKNAQRIAVFATRQALPLFETEHPNDDRPRKAIKAAEAVIESNTAENREKARLAADAAWHAWTNASTSATADAARAAYQINRKTPSVYGGI